MLDIQLNPETWDLAIPVDDLVIIESSDETIQHIRQRLQHFQEEWFLDLEAGVPWLQEILGKVQHITTVEVILKDVIQNSPGVDTLDAFSLDESAGERTIAVTFAVTLTDGNSLNTSLEFTV